jgi:plasmid stability protein
MGSTVKKVMRPEILLPLAVIGTGGAALGAFGPAAKAAMLGTAGTAGTGLAGKAATGSLMGSGMVGLPGTASTAATKGILGGLLGTGGKLSTAGKLGLGSGALGLASLFGKDKRKEPERKGPSQQEVYDLGRLMNQKMGGAMTNAELNTALAPLLSRYGGDPAVMLDPDEEARKRREMYRGLNYSGLTRAAAEGGSIEPIDEEENRQIIMEALFGETMPGMNEDAIAQQMFDMQRRERLNPTGRANGGRVNMGLGGLLGRAFREGMEAAMKNPNLGKIFGRSGGDLDIGDVEKIIKAPPKVAPRDRRVGGIDVFGRRRPRDIDPLQDEVIDQMMEMDSFADGGSIPQTNNVPNGMQLDGRGGGFIPMGARERKDDVPAMLAKNEFVMTADAVRGMGNGDVNQGAQRMYDLMNNLESKV